MVKIIEMNACKKLIFKTLTVSSFLYILDCALVKRRGGWCLIVENILKLLFRSDVLNLVSEGAQVGSGVEEKERIQVRVLTTHRGNHRHHHELHLVAAGALQLVGSDPVPEVLKEQAAVISIVRLQGGDRGSHDVCTRLIDAAISGDTRLMMDSNIEGGQRLLRGHHWRQITGWQSRPRVSQSTRAGIRRRAQLRRIGRRGLAENNSPMRFIKYAVTSVNLLWGLHDWLKSRCSFLTQWKHTGPGSLCKDNAPAPCTLCALESRQANCWNIGERGYPHCPINTRNTRHRGTPSDWEAMLEL